MAPVWHFTKESGADYRGQLVLCEPFIENYQKFNSNSGWNDYSKGWGEAMQALSHFSYHVSDGSYVLCDLLGGIDQHEVILSDPVILSRTREFGVTDLTNSRWAITWIDFMAAFESKMAHHLDSMADFSDEAGTGGR